MKRNSKKIKKEGEDRISRLPDDLIHHILSFTTTKLAVQTCILSKRWQHIWATLPHLNLYKSNFRNRAKFSLFLTRFFTCRNHQSDISTVNLNSDTIVSFGLLKMIVSYAFAHNVQNLSIDTSIPLRCHIPLSIVRHKSLKKLRIDRVFRKSPLIIEGLCWWLPALTVLDITGCDLPESFLNLPALTTLCLNLTLERCKIQQKVINVSSLQLTNLTIKYSGEVDKFVISAPKLSAFDYSGFAFDYSWSLTEYVFSLTSNSLQKVNLETARLIGLLQELQNAKFLTINRGIIEVLSKVPDLLDQHSPLKNLKFLKVKEDQTIPSHVRTYLLSGSPSATIVKEFPKV